MHLTVKLLQSCIVISPADMQEQVKTCSVVKLNMKAFLALQFRVRLMHTKH